MLGLLPMITFALWWTFVVAVILPKDFNEMPEELKDAFKEFVRRNQPLKITRDTELNILPRGSVLWPEEGIEVFLGKKFNKNPDLEDFREYRDWGNLYMDERTHTFLKRIEYQLSAVIPTFDDKRWFRSALSDSFHPRRRGDSSPADVLRYVINHLLERTDQYSRERRETVRDNIRLSFDLRFGRGSLDGQ